MKYSPEKLTYPLQKNLVWKMMNASFWNASLSGGNMRSFSGDVTIASILAFILPKQSLASLESNEE